MNRRILVFQVALIFGIIPTVGIFVWGIVQALSLSAVPLTTPFQPMR